MKQGELLQRLFFRIRLHGKILSYIRRFFWWVQGASIGKGTSLPRLTMNWPHQVSIGKNCILEDDIFFKFAASWQPGPSIVVEDRVFIGKGCEFNICTGVQISNDCLIASGCKFIDADHGTEISDGPMNKQSNLKRAIKLEEDVWLGVNVVVLKGVTIGKGAVVGAGAVVTKCVPAYEIWAGVPAKKIGQRG